MSVYNGAAHVRTAVESIIAQTYGDFEFVIVNDGSTDGTAAILAEYAARDPRVRVIDQANQGLTRALITGCAQARGEFIARQDADDWSAPTRLEKLVAVLDATPAAVMSSSWAHYVDDSGEIVETIERPVDPAQTTHALLHERHGPPAHGSVLFRREAYEQAGGYRPAFYYAQDSDLWLRLGLLGQIAYVPEVLYHARLSPNGISSARAHWQSQFGDLGQRCHAARLQGESEADLLAEAERLRGELLSSRTQPTSTRHQQAAAHYRIGTSLARRKSPHARRHFWEAIRLNPLHWKSWCRLCAALFVVTR
jgi:glycosyltransferase involved in cell wall biosynthesis